MTPPQYGKPAPCPTCSLGGGFHDRAIHAQVDVPAELLRSGDRRDDWVLEKIRVEHPALYAAHLEVTDRFVNAVVYGSASTRAKPAGLLAALDGET